MCELKTSGNSRQSSTGAQPAWTGRREGGGRVQGQSQNTSREPFERTSAENLEKETKSAVRRYYRKKLLLTNQLIGEQLC